MRGSWLRIGPTLTTSLKVGLGALWGDLEALFACAEGIVVLLEWVALDFR